MKKITIKSIRLSNGYTQGTMAEAIEKSVKSNGMPDYHLTRIGYSLKERGINDFTWAEIKAIARICDISVSKIV